MNTQPYLVKYILVHLVSYTQWTDSSYQQKTEYHYAVTATGKVIVLKPLQCSDGSIEVAFIGSEVYAQDSAALFGLLMDLWLAHPEAKIIYTKDLQNSTNLSFVNAACWLVGHMPAWLQKRLPAFNNLLTLRSQLPII